tara:strand:+ start:2533 stop:3663 length:1131 start_codon:yes stop_codon:yes gene_type:complete
MYKYFAIIFVIILQYALISCSEDSSTNGQKSTFSVKEKSITENFETFLFKTPPTWLLDNLVYDGPYSEIGEYYQENKIFPPREFRTSVPIGEDNWLVAEIYTRTENPILLDYIDIKDDPESTNNKVLKISTPKHTDGVVLRSKNPLPAKYRITLKIGYASYGDETPLNGHDVGNEMAEPWVDSSSVGHNGFYWLAITDTQPRPHNNIWLHHHRKFVIDSWNRKGFNNTVNVIALDGKSETHQAYGKKFISYVDNKWQRVLNTPLDYYLDNEWYTVTFTRTPLFYEFSIHGKFKNAGIKTYKNKINIRKECIYHYNQTIEELSPSCVDNRSQTFMNKEFEAWPINSAYPEYFMLGEPHINYYEGSVLIDDISLEVLD